MSGLSIINSFSNKYNRVWKNINDAYDLTRSRDSQLQEAARTLAVDVLSTDVDLVFFGSMGRYECTSGSDADWTMLVDGQAKGDHRDTALLLEKIMQKGGLQKPGTSGMFGQITFSHSLLHNVGGQEDTNHNLTRRILLLLESRRGSLLVEEPSSGNAYDRVIRGIIHQYINNDSGFLASSGKENVPRFLLNDIIRYWRTMCVDFASKQIQQPDEKWALRNIKLRMSRKLIFVKGLLLCSKSFRNERMDPDSIKEMIYNDALKNPLQYILEELQQFKLFDEDLLKLYSSYDEYLGLLNQQSFRSSLKNLSVVDAYNSSDFKKARKISHDFQNALQNIFLMKKSKLQEFTLKYGLF